MNFPLSNSVTLCCVRIHVEIVRAKRYLKIKIERKSRSSPVKAVCSVANCLSTEIEPTRFSILYDFQILILIVSLEIIFFSKLTITKQSFLISHLSFVTVIRRSENDDYQENWFDSSRWYSANHLHNRSTVIHFSLRIIFMIALTLVHDISEGFFTR